MSAAHDPGFIRVPVYDAADITRFFRAMGVPADKVAALIADNETSTSPDSSTPSDLR